MLSWQEPCCVSSLLISARWFLTCWEGKRHLPPIFPPHWCGSLTTLSWIINVKGSRIMMWYMTICLHFNSFSDSCLYGVFRRLWTCCWMLWGLHEGVIVLTSFTQTYQSKPGLCMWNMKIVGNKCLWCSFSYNESEWAWTTIKLEIWCISILKVLHLCVKNRPKFGFHQLQEMWQLMSLSVIIKPAHEPLLNISIWKDTHKHTVFLLSECS